MDIVTTRSVNNVEDITVLLASLQGDTVNTAWFEDLEHWWLAALVAELQLPIASYKQSACTTAISPIMWLCHCRYTILSLYTPKMPLATDAIDRAI